ncbi:alkaline phosphatase family protein [Altererythrobacter sp. CC-YST694]|uniref:alkaline phosphatase family protein n=1 Tax=Altererythrobacter sp. CC-YST694 TaxID=2755038 RepID=UPI001D031FCF|nr:ectonucleotide pyrophosphatase/phosphodiesterase [Altererythrobacter sp. CC-YST694]MCB5424442.1 alkaline phosphatase family protein [Altererythrobacter sp. CC-YST694]
MRWFKTLIAAACAAFALPLAAQSAAPAAIQAEQREPITILISLDGFRPDYLARGLTPNLEQLAAGGVKAAMIPSFPSLTFPNHHTIATGLRPDRHGIIGNTMTDPSHSPDFWVGGTDAWWWNEALPIWVAAERAGIPTATEIWPGTTVATNGIFPTDWHQFGFTIGMRQRTDSIIDWARRPAANRPRFMMLYIEELDHAGHEFGPDSPEVNETLAALDLQIGRMRDELASMGQPANLVVVSDHGMAARSEDRVIALYKEIDGLGVAVEQGAYSSINPLEGKDAALAEVLLKPHDHMQCWRKSELPARFEYGKNARVPEFFCLGETGWAVRGKAPKPGDTPWNGGTHGWDNQDPLMRAVFIANGPAFKSGVSLPAFDNVDVEPLLRELIGLPSHDAEIDGSASVFRDALAR